MSPRENRFHVADFVVFGVTVLISIGIGVYYALSGGKQKTISEYLLGGRLINFLPVAISLLVSFESSIMMLGLPAEGYFYGIQLVMVIFAGAFINVMSVYLLVPLMHPLKITSAYEYLELRFKSKAVRLLGTVMGMLTYVWYMGIVLFGPAIALEAVTGFPLWTSISVIALVSVIYTSIGGLKAVVWTDVFQAVVMFAGIFAFLIKGTMKVGGTKQVWDTAMEGGRLQFFNFDPNPMVRHTFWGLMIGTMVRQLAFCFNQSTIQRISSTSTMAQAKRVMWLVTPCFALVTVMGIYEGTVAYAYFQTKGCDPYESRQITNQNQLMPYMVMEIFQDLPGMPGLFLTSLFSASLSTLSSLLSSLSAILWSDVIHPLVGDISDLKGALIAKFSVLVFGVIACGLAFLVSLIGGVIHQIASVILGAFSCPVSGMFLLGCFCPRVTAKGAMVGGIAGLALTCWISFGMNFSPTLKPAPMLPSASTDQCLIQNGLPDSYVDYSRSWLNDTYVVTKSTTLVNGGADFLQETNSPSGVDVLYSLSYMWLPVIGLITTMLVGYLTSLITGPNKPGDVDPRYLMDFSSSVLFICPSRFQKWFSALGTQFIKDDYKRNSLLPPSGESIVPSPMYSTAKHGDETPWNNPSRQNEHML